MLQNYTKNSFAWIQTVGSIWIIYAYVLSNKKKLWQCLLLHAFCGFIAIAIENYYNARKACCVDENWRFLLGFNELFWSLNEVTAVLYSLLKMEAIIVTNSGIKKFINYLMAILLTAFILCRGYVGFLRVRDNTTYNPEIQRALSVAFSFWLIADLIIFLFLIAYTIRNWFKVNGNLRGVVGSLFTTSLARMLIITANTLAMVVLGQIQDKSLLVTDLYDLTWSIKGTYSIILLFDLQATKNSVMASEYSKESIDKH
jgi:multisubunit Na+/H+ antiporter MnhG subunit